MVEHELGILLQGRVSNWTNDIINEYKKIFPSAEIVFSTWSDETHKDIDCKIVRSEKPPRTHPHDSNINFQIIGCREGLKIMNSKIVLKCRSDIFIHNKNIFNIFKENCPPEKIMTDNWGTFSSDYRVSDFCLLGRKKVLDEFWNKMPLYDGSYPIPPESYFGKMYVTKIKNDNRLWKEIVNDYFYVRDYHLDFQIEWEKISTDDEKALWYEENPIF